MKLFGYSISKFLSGGKKEKIDISFTKNTPIKKHKFIEKKFSSRPDLTALNYEPLARNRYVLQIPFEDGLGQYFVRCQAPNMMRNEHVRVGDRDWFQGRRTWSDFYVEFIDPIGHDSSEKLMEWIRAHSTTVTGRGYNGYKKNMTLEKLDPTGVVLDRWNIIGAFPTQVTFVDMDNNNGDINMTFSIDYCNLVI